MNTKFEITGYVRQMYIISISSLFLHVVSLTNVLIHRDKKKKKKFIYNYLPAGLTILG